MQAARQVVGERGFVLGVDKEPITHLRFENVHTIMCDITLDRAIDEIKLRADEKFDVVVSDLSPNVSGAWEVDHARQMDLARHALKISRIFLKPSGNVLVKVFQGSELKEFQLEMKSLFEILRIIKPPASRPESAELYFLGLGFLG